VEACEGWLEDMISPLLVSCDCVAVAIRVLGAPFDAVTVVVTRLWLTETGVSGVLEMELDDVEEMVEIDEGKF
jgi:hypothetical protein